MLIADENLPAAQRRWLRKRRIRLRVVGADIASRGSADENLISLLHRLPQPTFFTLDRDFYSRDWLHPGYCLVWLDVTDDRAAEFIRRFLRHPRFETQAKRMGIVARVHTGGVSYWEVRKRSSLSVPWLVH
jgi:hypothetical protein